jgi:hypothetical protein
VGLARRRVLGGKACLHDGDGTEEEEVTHVPLLKAHGGNRYCWDHASSPKVLQEETASAEAVRM